MVSIWFVAPLKDSDPKKIKDWTLEGRLGSGGTGVVYRGIDSKGSVAAIKVLRPELVDDPQVRERLRREADVLMRVRGGRTAEVFEVDVDIDTPFIAMQLVEGVSLNEFIEKNGPVKGTFAWAMVDALVEALRSIHAAGVIHRDLKPSNIIVGPDGVMVVDFGISVIHDAASSTQTGAMIGTVAWLSPEQITGQRATEQSDVFNLGMVLSYAFTGRHPYGEGRPDAVMFRVAHGEPNLEGLPAKFGNLIKSCLTKDPGSRPSLQAVELILSGVSKGDSSGEDVGKVNETFVIDRTVLEAMVKPHSRSDNDAAESVKVAGLEKVGKTNSKELRILLGLVAVLAPIIFFVVKNNQDSGSDNAAVEVQEISSTSLQPIVVVPTTIPVTPEFKLADYKGNGRRFDPCDGPITVAVNFGTRLDLLQKVNSWLDDAVTDISSESGLEFIYTGATLKVPKYKYRDGRNGSSTILIGLLQPGESGATVIKKGESWGWNSFVSVGNQVSGSQWTPMEAVDAEINTDYVVREIDIRRLLLTAIGLDYVVKGVYGRATEIMAASDNGTGYTPLKTTPEWGPGDILGMKAVGIRNGCIG